MIKRGVGSGAAKLPKICVFDLKTTFSPKKTEKNHKNHFRKYCQYSILKVWYSLLKTVKRPRDSVYEILDDRDSQPILQSEISDFDCLSVFGDFAITLDIIDMNNIRCLVGYHRYE